MKIYFTIDDKGYLTGWGSTRSTEKDIELDLADNHEFFKTDHQCWKYENGELVFDEEKRQRLIEEYEREQNKPTELERLEVLEKAMLELILRGGAND